MKKFDLIRHLTLNLTFKVKCHFGNRVILKAWPIMILSGMVASFEQKMPSKVFLRALACRLMVTDDDDDDSGVCLQCSVTTVRWRNWHKRPRLTDVVSSWISSSKATASCVMTSVITTTLSFRAWYDAGCLRPTTTAPTADSPSTIPLPLYWRTRGAIFEIFVLRRFATLTSSFLLLFFLVFVSSSLPRLQFATRIGCN